MREDEASTMKRSERIKRLQKRLAAIDRAIAKLGAVKPGETARIREMNKLLDRYDFWEERLVIAETK